jgi:hypothetical protein
MACVAGKITGPAGLGKPDGVASPRRSNAGIGGRRSESDIRPGASRTLKRSADSGH